MKQEGLPRAEKTEQNAMLHRCLCCEKTYSLLPFAGYDYGSICPHCGWEEDALDPIGYSCANSSTLEEYRKKHQVAQS